MLKAFTSNLRRFYRRLGWTVRRRSKPKIVIKKLAKLNSKTQFDRRNGYSPSPVINRSTETGVSVKPIRVATFNAALFSMAQAIPQSGILSNRLEVRNFTNRPRSILKNSPLHPKQDNHPKSRLRVSINLPDNEISLSRSGRLIFETADLPSPSSPESSSRKILKGKAPLSSKTSDYQSNRTIFEVLRDLDADILALQDVKAEEEKNMKPLSDLASALGMTFVFADSWAPQFGNAILSKWPIKRWKAHKIFDDSDFRIVLMATIEVPQVGEINMLCTLLDHLDEKWRMEQVNAIIGSTTVPHILAGGLNALDETDYSNERWADIVKYHEEMGKPTPKSEVMKQLRKVGYTDAKNFAGECESIVVLAKGQSVQGTCKYGTRVDYIMSSLGSPYKFVPGSYNVVSSKGTSDHHIVKVDVVKVHTISCNTQPQCNTSSFGFSMGGSRIMRPCDFENPSFIEDDCLQFRCIVTVVGSLKVLKKYPFKVPPSDIGIHSLSLLESGKGADVIFEVDGEKFSAHKAILTRRSSVFDAQFFRSLKDTSIDI